MISVHQKRCLRAAIPTSMKIILANPRGFCAGVYMAIDVVEQLLDICPNEPLYVFHEIVHNKHVVNRFRDRGVTFVDDLNDVPEGSIVVFSAHGVSPAVREQAEARRLTAIDATCPLVTKVHAEAVRYAEKGYQILLVGHEDHQEVVGTRGEAPDAIQVVESPEDVANITVRDPARVVYLTQTTLSMDDANSIIGALRTAVPTIKDPPSEDICYATTNRQHAVRALARDCDCVLVVGSKNSSNSQRLREIAEAAGTPAYLIDDKSELQHRWFEGVATVLVTAGASAPEHLVKELILQLIHTYGGEVEQHDVYHEAVEFGLPGTLKKFMRSRGIDPTGRRITMDNATAIQQWLDEQRVPNRIVDLTSGVTG
jgi:4-hydroxy-3-methylbut-2-en-1-yl diphosphate reductase